MIYLNPGIIVPTSDDPVDPQDIKGIENFQVLGEVDRSKRAYFTIKFEVPNSEEIGPNQVERDKLPKGKAHFGWDVQAAKTIKTDKSLTVRLNPSTGGSSIIESDMDFYFTDGKVGGAGFVVERGGAVEVVSPDRKKKLHLSIDGTEIVLFEI